MDFHSVHIHQSGVDIDNDLDKGGIMNIFGENDRFLLSSDHYQRLLLLLVGLKMHELDLQLTAQIF